MSLFDRARDWLAPRMQAAAGVSVTYTRSSTTLSLTAWVGRTLFSSVNEGGARVEWGDRDYLIPVADLTLGEPAVGDRIVEVIDGSTLTFEVKTPNTGEPAWRYADQSRAVYRLHVRRV